MANYLHAGVNMGKPRDELLEELAEKYYRSTRQIERYINQCPPSEQQEQKPYEETPSAFDPRLWKHREDVLGLLDKLLLELKLPNAPVNFVSLPNSQEDMLACEIIGVKFDAFQTHKGHKNTDSLKTMQLTNLLMKSGSSQIERKLQIETEPGFAALRGHYKHTGLWRDIKTHEKLVKEYLTISRDLHATVIIHLARQSLTKDRAQEILNALHSIMKALDSDKGRLSEQLGQVICTNTKTLHGANCMKSANDLLQQMYALEMKWRALKRLEAKITKGVETERLKGTLPAKTTCKFCTTV